MLGSRWEPHEEDENTGDTVWCLRLGELCSSWCLLCIDSGQKGIGSQYLDSSFVYVVAIPHKPLASWAGNSRIWLRTRDNLLPT